MSNEELALEREYTLARRSLFAVLSLIIGGILLGFFDTIHSGSIEASSSAGFAGQWAIGLLLIIFSVYLAFPQLSNPKS